MRSPCRGGEWGRRSFYFFGSLSTRYKEEEGGGGLVVQTGHSEDIPPVSQIAKCGKSR